MAGINTSIGQWDYSQYHVQRELLSGQFINSASTVIAAGPPFLSGGRSQLTAAGGAASQIAGAVIQTAGGVRSFSSSRGVLAYPIGVIENLSLQQNRQLQRLFEIGSKRSYFVVGRNVGAVSIARTLFYGPSLMRALYAYISPDRLPENVKRTVSVLLQNADRDLSLDNTLSSGDRISLAPGYAEFFSNLDSELFDIPMGIMIYMLDAQKRPYGAMYLEEAHINSHSLTISASNSIIAEGVTIQYDQAVPLDVGAAAIVELERQQQSRNDAPGSQS